MAKKTTTSSNTLARTPRTEEDSSSSGTPAPAGTTAPAADAPGAAPASPESAPSPGAATAPAAPTAAQEAPTGTAGTAGTAAEGGAGGTVTDEKKGGATQIVTRFPPELAARLDRFTDSLRNGRFGLRVSRADAVRILVNEGLAHFEKEQAAAPSAPRG